LKSEPGYVVLQEDVVSLMCSSGDSAQRDFLAAEGFGSQVCHLESDPYNTQVNFEIDGQHPLHSLVGGFERIYYFYGL